PPVLQPDRALRELQPLADQCHLVRHAADRNRALRSTATGRVYKPGDAPPARGASMTTDIDVQHDGHVDIITINRPDVRNALRFQSYDELEAAVRQSQARAIVITGADPAFCSGDDVREIMGGGEKRDKPVISTPR